MTTITHDEYQAALSHFLRLSREPQCGDLSLIFAAAGINIAPPEPPEGMVKLAREIAAKEGSWTERYGQEILDGRVDDHYGVKIALAALQFADKVVREAPCVPVVGAPIVHKDAIRRKLGAIA